MASGSARDAGPHCKDVPESPVLSRCSTPEPNIKDVPAVNDSLFCVIPAAERVDPVWLAALSSALCDEPSVAASEEQPPSLPLYSLSPQDTDSSLPLVPQTPDDGSEGDWDCQLPPILEERHGIDKSDSALDAYKQGVNLSIDDERFPLVPESSAMWPLPPPPSECLIEANPPLITAVAKQARPGATVVGSLPPPPVKDEAQVPRLRPLSEMPGQQVPSGPSIGEEGEGLCSETDDFRKLPGLLVGLWGDDESEGAARI